MNGFLDVLLRFGGVPQETLDKVEQASPAAVELIQLVKSNQTLIAELGAFYVEAKPLIDRALALYSKAQPLVAQATPLVSEAWGDIEKLLPVAQDVLAFLNKHGATAPTTQQDFGASGNSA